MPSNLAARKTRLIFETADTARERGAWRPVVIECEPTFARVRLKGTRTRYVIEWSAIYSAAAKLAAARDRAERQQKKRGAK